MRCAVLCLTWLRPPVLAEHSIRPHHTLTVTKVDNVLYPGNVDPQLVGRAIGRIVHRATARSKRWTSCARPRQSRGRSGPPEHGFDLLLPRWSPAAQTAW